MSDEPRKRGRPSVYTPEIAAEICERLAKGESLTRITKDEHMPHEATVRGWALEDREGFFPQYTRARAIQAHRIFDETLEIADYGLNDTYTTEDGKELTNYDVIARSKLRVDTRKWYLSKVLPKIYGERVAMEHSGPGGGPIEVAQMSDDEIEQRATALRQRLAGMIPSTNGHKKR